MSNLEFFLGTALVCAVSSALVVTLAVLDKPVWLGVVGTVVLGGAFGWYAAGRGVG